jgi:hypothetical protein
LLLIPRLGPGLGAGGGGLACATATLVTEVVIVISLLSALGSRCFDRRLISASTKNIAAAILVTLFDLLALKRFGVWRLGLDAVLYTILVLASGGFDYRGLMVIVRGALERRRLRRTGSA